VSSEDWQRGVAANQWSQEPRSDRYDKQNIVMVLHPGARDVIQCYCWHDVRQRTSYISFPRACCWWVFQGHVVGGLLVEEGQKQEECGPKPAKTRWVANDIGRK
jgi:hypothetical protein